MMTTAPKPFVFTLMPFDKKFDDTYKLGIKVAADDAGGYCERVDEQIFDERMLDRIYNQINKADVIVADLTDRNPNVFYEVGYAHALEKRVILLTQSADDIPFDLKHHYHIVYNGSIVKLKDELGKRLKWYFDNPEKTVPTDIKQIEIFLWGQKIESGANIINKTTASGVWSLDFTIHNISNSYFGTDSKIGLKTKKEYKFENHAQGFEFYEYNNQNLFISNFYLDVILPDCWSNLNVFIMARGTDHYYDISIPVTLVLYTPYNTHEIDFTITDVYDE